MTNSEHNPALRALFADADVPPPPEPFMSALQAEITRRELRVRRWRWLAVAATLLLAALLQPFVLQLSVALTQPLLADGDRFGLAFAPLTSLAPLLFALTALVPGLRRVLFR